MNNCENCIVDGCIKTGTNAPGCKLFELRTLTEFEKTLTRRGIICGWILGFLFAISITWPFWRILP